LADADARSPLDLMAIQAATLFRHDAQERLTTVNEPGGGPAPRIFIGRTVAGNVVRLRDDLPAHLADELLRIIAEEPPLRDPQQQLLTIDRLRRALGVASPVQREWSGPAWWVPPIVSGRDEIVTTVLHEPSPLWRDFPGWATDLSSASPCVAVLEDGLAVAVCCSARTSPNAAEAGVETLPSHRGRGLAGAVVAAWAAEVRGSGRLPLYSTSWDNSASQSVARRLGLRFYGVDVHLT